MDYTETRNSAATNGRPIEAPHDAELDHLTDLFLGPAENAGAPPTRAETATTETRGTDSLLLEAVIAGHLPISASAWPGQYARRRAEQGGAPVGVVRLSGGLLTVDLIGAPGHARAPADDRDALELAGELARVVILRVEEACEEELASIPGLGRVCLLTGADDAAVVACYRKLKALSGAAPHPLPDPRLAIMGADEPRAQLAHQRIAKAAREFLGAEMRQPVVIERIGPTGSASLFRGASELTIGDIVSLLTAPTGAPIADTRLQAAPRTPATPEPVRPTETARAPAAPTDPESADRGTEGLTALVRGIRPIESRCPRCANVELGVDADGRLQLVAGALAGLVTTADPVADLVQAAAWADAHAPLLARAEPSIRRTDAVLHLVTDDTRAATGLAGSSVRVHLAVPATPMAYGMTAIPLDPR